MPRKAPRHTPLDDVDRAIVRELVARPGTTYAEIGARLGYSEHRISRRMQNPTLREAITRETERTIEKAVDATAEAIVYLKKLHLKAVKRLEHLMDNAKSEQVQFAATNKIVDGLAEIAAGTVKQVGKDVDVTEEDVIEAAKFLVQSEGEKAKDEG